VNALDILYWSALFLGASYMVLTLAIGGLSHALGGLHHGGGHLGTGGGHAGHLDTGGGHAGHLDTGGGHAGHLGTGGAHGHGAHVDTGAGHHADAGHGHHAGAHHGHDHAAEAEETGGRFPLLTYLNPIYVTGLLLGFGGGGIASRSLTAQPLQSLLWAGLLGGAMYWGTTFLVARLFGAAQASSHMTQEGLIGMRALVTATIEGSHAGTICLTVKGTRAQLRAVTEENESIAVGAAVRIRRIEKGTAHVTLMERLS
jgi:hypothetical protein